VGNCLGAGDQEEARRTILVNEALAAVIGAAVMLTVLMVPELIVRLFSSDPQTIALGSRALRFFAPFYFIEILGYSFEIIFTGNGWGRFVLASEFGTNIIFILGSTLVLTVLLPFGIRAAWLSFGLYQVFHALILLAGFLSQRWQRIEVD
jgi:Na+-driven multidrug efflux pump